MNKLNVSGSYYEIGCQLGKKIKKFFKLPQSSKETIGFAQECRQHVKQHAPGLLDELKGLSENLELDLKNLEAFVLALGKDMIDQSKAMFRQGIDFGCSSIAISGDKTESGLPLFGRNYDWMESFKKYLTAVWTNPNGRILNLAFTDHLVGRYGGSNQEGLTMTIHAVPSYEPDWVPGLRMNIIARWVLDNFASVKEAIQYFEKIPHITGHLYLIADKSGALAVIETAKDDVIVTEKNDGYLAITNDFITESLRKYQDTQFVFPNSQERYKKIKNWSNNKRSQIAVNDVQYLLSDHEIGVCNHFEFGGEKTSTIWSWITSIGTGEILVSHGSPCKNRYRNLNI